MPCLFCHALSSTSIPSGILNFDPFNRLATMHQHYRQTWQTHRTTVIGRAVTYLYLACNCNGRPKRVLKFKIEFKTYWLICNYMFYAPRFVNKHSKLESLKVIFVKTRAKFRTKVFVFFRHIRSSCICLESYTVLFYWASKLSSCLASDNMVTQCVGVRRFRYMTVSVHTLLVHVFFGTASFGTLNVNIVTVTFGTYKIWVQSTSVHKCQFRYKHLRYKSTLVLDELKLFCMLL